jgi:GTPase KRas
MKESSGTLSFFKIGNNGNVPVMLVGNKSDKITEREISFKNRSALAKELRYAFIKTSIKTCFNVEKTFYDVIRSFRR